MKQLAWMIVLFGLFGASAQAAEAMAGKVGYMSGTLVAQRADGTLRVLGSKSEVFAGETLVTAASSYAQVQMNDGAKMTLRPNSNLRIEAYTFDKEAPSSDNAVLRLLKGGFRTVTGLIGKRGNPDAYRLNASTATIGIRGTDFSSRLCASKNCQEDESDKDKPAVAAAVNHSQVVGRVMLVQGELSAKNATGKVRKLTLGAPVYEGDELMTGKKSYAVVAFRDEGRVSLQENTAFRVEKFKYDKANSQENAVMRLLKGGVRVVSGLIGRVNHENYQFRLATATIGIRGTGFDSWCNGPCAQGDKNAGATEAKPLDGAGVYVWAGEVILVSDCTHPDGVASCPSQIVGLQQAAILDRNTGKPVPVKNIPANILNNDTPRPDGVPANMEKLFGTQDNDGEPGLYVTVHDGNVILAQRDKKIDLGTGETGFADSKNLMRLPSMPTFMGGNEGINGQMGRPNSPGGCAVQ